MKFDLHSLKLQTSPKLLVDWTCSADHLNNLIQDVKLQFEQ